MPTWDLKTLDRFIEAESALVARQLSAPRGKDPLWAAWKNNATIMREYGSDLVEGRFEKIKEAVTGLI
jgi:hypothetical protein